jgi:pyruvate kinase
MAQTKIVVTIGPATCDRESLLALHEAGMSVARLNGSHADLEWHSAAIQLIRSLLPNLPILLDIPGRKIRTVLLAHEPHFVAGDRIILTTDISFDGHTKVPVNYLSLHADVKPGDLIVADDGTLGFSVEAIEGPDIICRATRCGTLRSRKGINVPFVKLNTSLITERDRQMVAFARECNVDFIGVSFVESAAHVHAIRELVGGKTPQILAKIENQGGMDHLDEVVEAADAIMIDRGDLSVETRLETLVIYQKRIINVARSKGKPVVVATEMLNSMIENDFPTKAEVADITNAVLDGCSATMLSGETAIGSFPVTAVKIMRQIADAAVAHLDNGSDSAGRSDNSTPTHAIEDAIAMILRSVPITKVVAITRGGYAARMLSARSVAQPIFAISDDAAMARSFNIYSGVEGIFFDVPFPSGSADHIKGCIRRLYELGKLEQNDLILVTGVVYPRTGTRMNLIQIHRVSDLMEEFDWKSAASNHAPRMATAKI